MDNSADNGKMQLRPYQNLGVQYLLQHSHALLADEPGLGKTGQALVALDAAQGYPALVVCPASVKTHWSQQARAWLGRTVHIINSGKDVVDDTAAITVVNYELLKVVRKYGSYQTIIIDELFKCKSEDAQRTHYVRELARRASVVWGLSGSPIVNRPLELVAQLDVLDRLRQFGGKWQFIYRYCNPHEREIWVPRWDPVLRRTQPRRQKILDCTGHANIPELHAKLTQLCMLRRLKSEVAMELPSRESLPLLIDLDDKGRKLYHDARRDLTLWLQKNSGRLQQAEALMRLVKMRQVAAEAKFPRLVSAIEDLLESGEKVVLYAWSTKLQAALLQHFGPAAAHILGNDSARERTTQIENFVRNPELSVMVASLMATAIGTDGLQRASRYAVFCDLGDEAEIHSQAIQRLHRIGQSKDVTAYYAVAVGTIEEEMLDRLIGKHAVTSLVADGRIVQRLLEAA